MRSALIIIDMQEGFINSNTKELIEKISRFIDKNKKGFETIIETQYVNHMYSPCHVFNGWNECMEYSTSVDIVPQLVSKADFIYKKDTYSCWHGQLRTRIKSLKVNKVYLCGVNIEHCILHSTLDIYNELQDCAVIRDLCGSTTGINSYNAAIQVLEECITKQRVVTAEQVEQEILRGGR